MSMGKLGESTEVRFGRNGLDEKWRDTDSSPPRLESQKVGSVPQRDRRDSDAWIPSEENYRWGKGKSSVTLNGSLGICKVGDILKNVLFYKVIYNRPGTEFQFVLTEARYCLRFGLYSNRIFGSETEDRGPPFWDRVWGHPLSHTAPAQYGSSLLARLLIFLARLLLFFFGKHNGTKDRNNGLFRHVEWWIGTNGSLETTFTSC